MDQFTSLENSLLKSLLGLGVAVAWSGWQRLRQWQDERRARAAEREFQVLRFETWRIMLATKRRTRRVKTRPVRRAKTGVVAVLVSQSDMQERVLRALGWRSRLWFTSSWAELAHVGACVAPFAIIADPVADMTGDPEGHLARFSEEWRIPVILYTALTSESARMLVRLGGCGIGHVVFRRYDDAPRRSVELVTPFEPRGRGPPSRAA